MCKAFEEIDDHRSPQNWSRCGRFISHIESLKCFAEQYKVNNAELLEASTWAAVYLDKCGLYEKAAMLDKWTLEQKKSILGKKHPSTLSSMNNLAEVLESLGKYEEAEEIHRQTLVLMESELGKASRPLTLGGRTRSLPIEIFTSSDGIKSTGLIQVSRECRPLCSEASFL